MAGNLMETKSVPGLELPVLGLGTWKMMGHYGPELGLDSKNLDAIRVALEMGVTHIDTAERYAGGHAERIVGKAIKGFDRAKLFITSKVAVSLGHNEVMEACRKSLERLGTSYLDMYLVHWPTEEMDLKETMGAFSDLVDMGLVKRIGVSNFPVSLLKEAQKNARHRIVCNQVEYSLLAREKSWKISKMESEVIPYCQRNGIMIVAYSPFANGRVFKEDLPALDGICEKLGKTRAQVAVNWLLAKPGIVTIAKASSPGHWKDIMGSLGWRLSVEDSKKLDSMEGAR